MREVRDGLIYDTDTAKLIGASNAIWHASIDGVGLKAKVELYLTPHGRYFEIETQLPSYDRWGLRWLNPLPWNAYYKPHLTPLSPRIARSLAERHGFDLEACGFEPEPA